MGVVLRPPDRIFPGYVLDLDGTVYVDDQLLPGVAKTVLALRSAGSRIVFVTNKPLDNAAGYAATLSRLGVPAESHDVVTALDALVRYLRCHHPGARPLALAEPLAVAFLAAAGFPPARRPEDADVVVVSFDRTFDYDKLLAGYRAVRAGAPIIATNPDPYCPTADGGLPDCAALLAALQACTGAQAEAVVGKPSIHMASTFCERLGVPAHDTAVVGDRLLTDVAMAKRLGMAGVLVLSGATTAAALTAELASAEVSPDFVVPGLSDLIPRFDRSII